MDYIGMLENYRVDYWTEGKNTRPGWVQVECPFCDDSSNHMGLSLETGACNCWRCGSHKRTETVAKVLSVTKDEAGKLLKQYSDRKSSKKKRRKVVTNDTETDMDKEVSYPKDCHSTLSKQHIKYLEKRGLDPLEMEAVWKLKGCGPMAKVGKISLKNRILAPIYWNGRAVSWQTRAVKDTAGRIKYITCPPEHEVISHKKVLYTMPNAEFGGTGIAVEGITDVWKLGEKGAGTFGVRFTLKQAIYLSDLFNRVLIMFDHEQQAQQQAEMLKARIRMLGTDAEIVNPLPEGTDPGDLTYGEAKDLVKDLT